MPEDLTVEDHGAGVDPGVRVGPRVGEVGRIGVGAVQGQVDLLDGAHADQALLELRRDALGGSQVAEPGAGERDARGLTRDRHGGRSELHPFGEGRHDTRRQPLRRTGDERLHDARLCGLAAGEPPHVGDEVPVGRIEEVQRVRPEHAGEAHLVDDDAGRCGRDAPLSVHLLEPVVEGDGCPRLGLLVLPVVAERARRGGLEPQHRLVDGLDVARAEHVDGRTLARIPLLGERLGEVLPRHFVVVAGTLRRSDEAVEDLLLGGALRGRQRQDVEVDRVGLGRITALHAARIGN